VTRRRYRPPRRRWGRRHEPSPVLLVAEDERGVLLAASVRLLWRYRSELAPPLTAAMLALVGAWAHARHPHWAVPLAAVTAALGAALAVPPDRWAVGRWAARWPVVSRPAERLYAASVLGLGGAWLAAATAYGPSRPPLPTVALLGALAAGIPWWAHHRRRARVRVERTLAAWPQFADAVGLPGSRLVSATVDRWGWTGRLALRRGQTVRNAVDQVGAIESALAVRAGSVRIEPDAGRADRAVLRVVETDPHAAPIRWRALAVLASVLDPVDLGVFEDGSPVLVRLAYRHALVGGVVGSGKSGVLNVLLAALVACGDAAVWGIDRKGGMELRPWLACLGRLATGAADSVALLRDAVAVLDTRADLLAARGERLWRPTPAAPALVVVVDEYAELPDDAAEHADSIARRGRAVAVTLLVATQRPTQQAMGGSAVRSQMDTRICLRVRERRDADLILGQGSVAAGWRADTLDAPGKFLISDPEHTTPRPARAYLIGDDDVRAAATEHAAGRPVVANVNEAGSSDVDQDQPSDGREPARGRPESLLWTALQNAPDDGVTVADLMRVTGMSRPWTYKRLREHAAAGRAVQTGRGRWRGSKPSASHSA
jgi:S-DNA-T family DNA segregation ATPase FtsK/SpoIIIE